MQKNSSLMVRLDEATHATIGDTAGTPNQAAFSAFPPEGRLRSGSSG